ncbi:MAG: ABC transporter permease [Proteobacteria bacterium]|nr:ABC transporter permease [Pseudomonadota bacterium]
MLGSHLQMALRSLFKQRLYTAISAIGLAIGLSVFLLISLFIKHEIEFDGVHPDSDRVYRLNWTNVGTSANFATFFNPVAPILSEGLPEIETYSRLALRQHLVTINNQRQFRNISFVDTDFFELFSYPALSGSTDSVEGRANVILTEAAALELFGSADAIGRILTIEDQFDFRVSGVVQNNPTASHLISNIFLNIENLPTVWGRPDFWDNFGSDVMYSYIRLVSGADPIEVKLKVFDFLANVPGFGNEFIDAVDITLQPLRAIHFTTDLQNEMAIQDDISGIVKPLRQRSDVYVFSVVAVLTLGIALINFMNLQIVQSSKRTREVGIRKTIGAHREQVAAQFLTETVLVTFIALIIALLISEIFAPLFGSIVAVPLTASILFTPLALFLLLLLAIVVALLSGAYPALIIARLSPVNALRGEIVKGVSSARFRSSLVVLQFSISIGLMISCAVVNNQIDYALTKSLGFNPEKVVVVNLQNSQVRGAYESMKSQLLSLSNIETVAAGSIIPTQSLSDGSAFVRVDDNDAPVLSTRRVSVSDDYFDALGMEFVAGRPLSDDFATDAMPTFSPQNPEVSGGVVFNEAAARAAGWNNSDDAIGQQLFSEFSIGDTTIRLNYTVVGIVNDAHYGSVRSEIGPVSYTLDSLRSYMVIKLGGGDTGDSLADIDRVWSENVPDFPLRRVLLRESYSAFYAGENRTFILFTGFATIAVLIACLGLYGLASFMAERRTKEISIRKVLGATVESIAGLLAWDFCKLVIVANLIAWPATWWLMNDWLTSFAYRTDMDFLVFFLAGLFTFIMALFTTFQRAYGVAVTNPVDALRTE